jgi:hypothetical protein
MRTKQIQSVQAWEEGKERTMGSTKKVSICYILCMQRRTLLFHSHELVNGAQSLNLGPSQNGVHDCTVNMNMEPMSSIIAVFANLDRR